MGKRHEIVKEFVELRIKAKIPLRAAASRLKISHSFLANIENLKKQSVSDRILIAMIDEIDVLKIDTARNCQMVTK